MAAQLQAAGHPVSERTVNRMLHELGYRLQTNRKTLEGRQHPDRDAQFAHINERCQAFQAQGQPVISVDTKKKELIGQYRNGGREWRPQGRPEEVKVYDFPDKELGKAIPYGVYDLVANEGWVSVGVDHDTAAFAVETIRRWWRQMGGRVYGGAQRLLITPTVAAPTPAATACGSWSCSGSPMSWGWRYRCAIFRPERASGTRSSTGCSVTLPRTGVDARW